MKLPNPLAVSKQEAYLAILSQVLTDEQEAEIDKPSLEHPDTSFEAWLAFWAGKTSGQYPKDTERDEPLCLSDEEALVAYITGVTDIYPKTPQNPMDIRLSAYLRYLIDERYGRPEGGPVTTSEFYLSLMHPDIMTIPEPSSDFDLNWTTEAPLLDLDVNGDTKQNTLSGKNLYPLNIVQSGTVNGVTYTNNGDSLDIKGTATAGIDRGGYIPLGDVPASLIQAGGTYTLSTNKPVPTGVRIQVNTYTDSAYAGQICVLTGDGSATKATGTNITIPTGATRVRYLVTVTNGTTVDITGLKIQLEAGSTATDFEPYCGGTASPNPDYPQAVNTVTGRQVVKVAGQNVFLAPNSANANFRSNFVKSSDNSFTLTATEGGINITAAYSRVDFTNLKKNTDYTVSWKKEVASAATLNRAGYVAYDLGGGTVTTPADSPITFNTGDSTTARLYFYIGHGVTSPGITIGDTVKFSEVQLQTGTEATTFVPYQNAEYELNLGKNLFDKDNVNLYAGYFQASGYIQGTDLTDLTSTTDRFFYIPCEPNTTYTITKPVQPTTKNNRFRVGTQSTLNVAIGTSLDDFWWMNDGQQTDITTHTIKTGPNARYLFVNFGKATTATNPGGEMQELLDAIQIEAGETATPYAPYFDPIELCKLGSGDTVYQDVIFRNNPISDYFDQSLDLDKWYIKKMVGKVVLDGSEDGWRTISNGAAGNKRFGYKIIPTFSADPVAVLAISDKYVGKNRTDNAQTPNSICVWSNNIDTLLIIATDSTSLTLDQFKSQLASSPVTAYYCGGEPTIEPIEGELANQLDAIMEGGSYDIYTSFKVTSDGENLPALLMVACGAMSDENDLTKWIPTKKNPASWSA